MVTWKDKKLETPKLSLEQHIVLLHWLRDEHMAEIKRQMVGLPLDLCILIWNKGREECRAIDLNTLEYKLALLTLQSLAYALYLAIREKEKEFTYKDALDVVNAGNDGVYETIMFDVLDFKKGE